MSPFCQQSVRGGPRAITGTFAGARSSETGFQEPVLTEDWKLFLYTKNQEKHKDKVISKIRHALPGLSCETARYLGSLTGGEDWYKHQGLITPSLPLEQECWGRREIIKVLITSPLRQVRDTLTDTAMPPNVTSRLLLAIQTISSPVLPVAEKMRIHGKEAH